MLFRRREPERLPVRIRVMLWPRRSWTRSTRYVINRVLRLGATPHAVAIGAAAGCLASFTPFLGLHFLLAGFVAWFLRGSVLASAMGTFVGNPLTFPFIWMGTYKVGSKILGQKSGIDHAGLVEHLNALSSSFFHASWNAMWQLLKDLWPIVLMPMTVGGITLGLAAATICYYLVRKTVRAYRHGRQQTV